MLENALYYIKTLLGVSTRYYFHSADFRVDGTGQGSPASDRAWGFNSSIYFDLQDCLSHGATYFSANGLHCIRICMTGFVDDNNLQTVENAFFHEANTNALVAHMNHDAQICNDTLWTSGGALALSKCQYHLMEWMFTISGKPILSMVNMETLFNCSPSMVPLPLSNSFLWATPTKPSALIASPPNPSAHNFENYSPSPKNTLGYSR
jgi:hypothetical protein